MRAPNQIKSGTIVELLRENRRLRRAA